MTNSERIELQDELARLLELQAKAHIEKKADYVKRTHDKIKRIRRLLSC